MNTDRINTLSKYYCHRYGITDFGLVKTYFIGYFNGGSKYKIRKRLAGLREVKTLRLCVTNLIRIDPQRFDVTNNKYEIVGLEKDIKKIVRIQHYYFTGFNFRDNEETLKELFEESPICKRYITVKQISSYNSVEHRVEYKKIKHNTLFYLI